MDVGTLSAGGLGEAVSSPLYEPPPPGMCYRGPLPACFIGRPPPWGKVNDVKPQRLGFACLMEVVTTTLLTSLYWRGLPELHLPAAGSAAFTGCRTIPSPMGKVASAQADDG